MQALEDISYKVNLFIFNHHISEDGIVCDEGDGNQTMVNGNNRRWSYTNTSEIGHRSELEDIQLHMLNDVMEIMTSLQMYFSHYGDGPIETVDAHTSKCQSFNCHPGCSCGAWDNYEPYVQEENYEDMGCATEEDKQRLLEDQKEPFQFDQIQTRSQTQAQAQAMVQQNPVDQMLGNMEDMSLG
jgi:hypothetical protein